VVCLTIPRRLYGVGMWYRDFSPVSDEQVVALMAEAGSRAGKPENAPGEASGA
jgi:putative phosphoribosyl transferase